MVYVATADNEFENFLTITIFFHIKSEILATNLKNACYKLYIIVITKSPTNQSGMIYDLATSGVYKIYKGVRPLG